MHYQFKNVLKNYKLIVKHPELLGKIKNPANSSDEALSEVFTDSFSFTEIELQFAPKDFQDFIRSNGFVISSEDKYGFTPPYEDFIYNLDRLKLHLKITKDAHSQAYMLHYDDPESLKDIPDYDCSDEESWEKYKDELNISKEVLYEQALISLIAIFEAFIDNTLKWIFTYNEDSRKNIKVKLSYSEVLENLDSTVEIINMIINRLVDEHHGWDSKYDLLNSKPHKISVRSRPEYNVIRDAVNKRNLLVHHRRIVNEYYINKDKNTKYAIGDRIHINEKYYNKIQSAINRLVKYLDKQLKEKYLNFK